MLACIIVIINKNKIKYLIHNSFHENNPCDSEFQIESELHQALYQYHIVFNNVPREIMVPLERC